MRVRGSDDGDDVRWITLSNDNENQPYESFTIQFTIIIFKHFLPISTRHTGQCPPSS